MRFIPLQTEVPAAEKAALEQEYAGGEDFTPARIGKTNLFFKNGRKVYCLPLSAITRCFRRVELIGANMGCCEQSLPMESVIVCGEGEKELAQIRVGTERMGKALLAGLEKACPEAKIGYARPADQKTAVRMA